MNAREEWTLPTRVAHAFYDDHLYFDYTLYRDLLGRVRCTGMLALAAGGPRLTDEECKLLDDLTVILTVADPRIWPLKLVRVVSSYGALSPAYAAGNLAMEQAMVGNSGCVRAANLIRDMRRTLGDRETDLSAIEAELDRRFQPHARLAGFGVFFRPRDERVAALTRRIEAYGRSTLGNWAFFERLARVVHAKRNVTPNIVGALSAACLDLGFEPEAVSPMMLALLQTAFLVNAVEGAAQAPAILRSLPRDAVEYKGKPPRESPRAKSMRG